MVVIGSRKLGPILSNALGYFHRLFSSGNVNYSGLGISTGFCPWSRSGQSEGQIRCQEDTMPAVQGFAVGANLGFSVSVPIWL